MKLELDLISSIDIRWQEVRAERDKLLREADVMINKATDNSLDTELLRQYRQALRNLPQNNSDPLSINWPDKPII